MNINRSNTSAIPAAICFLRRVHAKRGFANALPRKAETEAPAEGEAQLPIVRVSAAVAEGLRAKVGDRHVVVYRNSKGTYVHSDVLIPTGKPGQLLLCYGTQSSATKELDLERAGAWFTKVCMTTKIDGR